MMKGLLENAGEFAKSKGIESICQLIKDSDDIGGNSSSESEHDTSVSSDDTPPRFIAMIVKLVVRLVQRSHVITL